VAQGTGSAGADGNGAHRAGAPLGQLGLDPGASRSPDRVPSPLHTAGVSTAPRPVRRGVRAVLRRFWSRRIWLTGGCHLLLFAAIYWLSFGLRFDFAIPPDHNELFLQSLIWVLLIKAMVFFVLGHYDNWWSYVTFADLLALIRASALSTFMIAAVVHFAWAYQVPRSPLVPRTVLLLDCVFTIVVLGAVRASWRLLREQFYPVFGQKDWRGAVVVGVDHANALLAHHVRSHLDLPFRIRGLVTVGRDEPRGRVCQIPILGAHEDIAEIAAAHDATDVLVTAGTLPGKTLRGLMQVCKEAGLNLKIVRPLADRFHGDHRIPVRNIEINDLLRREPVRLDADDIGEMLRGRTVLVTGAGGSIGSEICRQVLEFRPRALILLGNGENPIFAVQHELGELGTSTALHACIGSVTDEPRMRTVFGQHRPDVVFHAAAHKHVPLMEDNAGEAIRNNVLGTKCLADLAHEFRVKNFVFISTDKAVHPTSVMGATKHVAEQYVHALSAESETRFTVVRFGNVLGSDGSVVPLFQDQIRRGGPITVTDPRMTRFFMTIPEASQLVLQAASMGDGGGEIFVLEMGQPVRIVDLARDLIQLSGLPENAIEIVFTGVRPGEKLYEELYFDDEETLPTKHEKIRAAFPRPHSAADVRRAIAGLERVMYGPDELVRPKLREIVPEYAPPSEEKQPPAESLVPAAGSPADSALEVPEARSRFSRPQSRRVAGNHTSYSSFKRLTTTCKWHFPPGGGHFPSRCFQRYV